MSGVQSPVQYRDREGCAPMNGTSACLRSAVVGQAARAVCDGQQFGALASERAGMIRRADQGRPR
jgi:hypothetical protein